MLTSQLPRHPRGRCQTAASRDQLNTAGITAQPPAMLPSGDLLQHREHGAMEHIAGPLGSETGAQQSWQKG